MCAEYLQILGMAATGLAKLKLSRINQKITLKCLYRTKKEMFPGLEIYATL